MINRFSENIVKHVMAALFAGCFFLVACENDPGEVNMWTARKVMVEEAREIESYLSQGGALRARLTSPIMFRYHSDTVYAEFPRTLHVDFYDSTLQVESWLTAMYGKYFETQNKVYLRDSVTVINRDGDTLRTPELWWDQSLGKFYTDKPARLDGKDKHIVGNQGLEASQDLKIITFKYPTGPLQVKDSGLP